MSYDIDNGHEFFNITYNVGPMFYDCYPDKGIRAIYGLTGREAIPILRHLRDHMEYNSNRLRAMEPANKWGSFRGALEFVNQLIIASLENPKSLWEGD